MWIVAYFTENGVPKTGLTPTIIISDLDTDSIIVNNASMSATSIPGTYKYNFTSYDNYKNYVFRCDGGVILENNFERYSYGINTSVSMTEMSNEFSDSDSTIN